jgi:hypothetical protein
MARSALKGAVMRITMGELEGRLRAIESSWDLPLICSSASRGSDHDGRILHFFRPDRAHHADDP